MAVSVPKKTSLPYKSTALADQAPKPAREVNVGIEEVFRLDGDYVLVKVATRAVRSGSHAAGTKHATATAFLDTTLPKIPAHKVMDLLHKFANQVVTGSVSLPVPAITSRARKSPAADSSKSRQFMDDMMKSEMAARVERIEMGELITAAELGERLAMSKQAISRAATTGRMFTLEGPSGKKVFPAFYADPRLDRQVLERVSKELGQLPGPSKWQFFTTGKVSLNGKSPIEAISEGHVNKVLAAATAFREH